MDCFKLTRANLLIHISSHEIIIISYKINYEDQFSINQLLKDKVKKIN